MPYYRWKGISIRGELCSGKQFASSSDTLNTHLLHREIGLMSVSEISINKNSRINIQERLQFFISLRELLNAGMKFSDCLQLIASSQQASSAMHSIVHDLHILITQGLSLEQAFGSHKTTFDPVTISLLNAGQRTGTIAHAVNLIVARMEYRQTIIHQIRSALFMPMITLIFFFGTVFCIVAFILPAFGTLFASLQTTLPPLTRALLAISSYTSMANILVFFGVFALVIYALWQSINTQKGALLLDKALLATPILSTLYTTINCLIYFRIIALTVNQEKSLVSALRLGRKSMISIKLQSQCYALEYAALAGQPLHKGMLHSHLFSDEIITMAAIGQESGALGVMFTQIASIYQHRLQQMLKRQITLIQPLLLLCIGLLVALLIVAIYVPLFTTSQSVMH